jgi:hypothetical protein
MNIIEEFNSEGVEWKRGSYRASEGVCPRAAQIKEFLFPRWGREKEIGRREPDLTRDT